MKNELINVREENGVKLVSARELHEGLESKERFSKWFDKMLKYGFIVNEDYTPYQMVHPLNKQDITDYSVTLDMGKELCMLSKLPKGRKYRKYFIECEKKLMQVQPKLPTTYKEALLALVEEVEKNEKLELENKQLGKEVEYKEDVIIGLTKDITLQEKRQRLVKIVTHRVKNPRNRWNMLYDELDKKFHIDTKKRHANALERGDIKKSVNRLGYICDNMDMTNEIYDVACKIFEGDFIELLDEWRETLNK